MRLRPEFETVRSTILNREQLNFDGVISSLDREETRLRTQAQFNARPGEGETILAGSAISARSGSAQNPSVLAVMRPQFNNRVPNAELECHHCHEKGHLVKHCRQRNYCVYCKRMGHIILECRTRERNAERWTGNSSWNSSLAGAGRGAHGRGMQGRGGSRPAYNVGEYNGERPNATAAQIEQLVQAVTALQHSLPTAFGSALSALQGHEDRETDRKGE
ncbi:unnamed protein product [Linum trigynum]|uniref:CCHC-type domain-containing protein n=1 Tax=Linum trigynum TaxID=586398 RepID=A0AAV2G595_9ROSI